MNRNKNLSRNGKANDLNNRAHKTSDRNKYVDNIEMISIPDIDYDSDDEYDGDEDNRIGPEDGLEITVDDSYMNSVPNRFKPNNYQIEELISRMPKKMTMRTAHEIARRLGILDHEFQIKNNLINQGFEPDADYDHENIDSCSVPISSKRRCWARKCDKPSCKIHDLQRGFENDDNDDVEHHLFKNQVI